ncbi:hypothetical protein SISSUDRAFT_964780, partial [Sistotremastrum suecicum HHB10207 ss-3]
LGRLPLVQGMPVIMTHNLDVHNGAVNGTRGTLVSVRYTVIGGERHASSCVMHVPNYVGPPLPGLEINQIAVIADTIEICLQDRH